MAFDKKVYWDRRNKGFRGQICVPGTKEFYYEMRRVQRLTHADAMKKLKKGVKSESKKGKAVQKTV